jgi:hypothetical protein
VKRIATSQLDDHELRGVPPALLRRRPLSRTLALLLGLLALDAVLTTRLAAFALSLSLRTYLPPFVELFVFLVVLELVSEVLLFDRGRKCRVLGGAIELLFHARRSCGRVIG